MQIVVKAQAVVLKTTIQCPFAGMPKGRMPDIVHQRQGLRQIHVQMEGGSHLARYLGYLDGVGQPAAEVIRGTAGKHLRLAR